MKQRRVLISVSVLMGSTMKTWMNPPAKFSWTQRQIFSRRWCFFPAAPQDATCASFRCAKQMDFSTKNCWIYVPPSLTAAFISAGFVSFLFQLELAYNNEDNPGYQGVDILGFRYAYWSFLLSFEAFCFLFVLNKQWSTNILISTHSPSYNHVPFTPHVPSDQQAFLCSSWQDKTSQR